MANRCESCDQPVEYPRRRCHECSVKTAKVFTLDEFVKTRRLIVGDRDQKRWIWIGAAICALLVAAAALAASRF